LTEDEWNSLETSHSKIKMARGLLKKEKEKLEKKHTSKTDDYTKLNKELEVLD